jgi:ComF family protein
MRAVVDRLVCLLLPAACLGCAAPLAAGRAPLGLCPDCRRRLVAVADPCCPRCGRPLAAASPPAGYLCGRCRRRPPAFEGLLMGWSYRPPVDAVIRGLKFAHLDYLGAHLADGIDLASSDLLEGLEGVVPVPLHWRRRLARGYNQAERIAAPLAARLGLPLLRALRRPRATAPQTGLGRRQRERNPRGAFRVRRRAPIAGKALLLVDDVVTTGATLDAAARELLRGGAARVVALAAARTPED